MGTRATLSVTDQNDRFDIYRHYDGYPNGPDGVIHDIHRAIDRAWPLPRFEAGDFAAAVVSEMKTMPGSVYLTQSAEAHSDRAFHYDVSFEDAGLRVVVHQYSYRVQALLPAFEGTIDEAVTKFDADKDYDGHPLDEQLTINIPKDGIILIADALDAAALDINQACKWRPDPDSLRALKKNPHGQGFN